MTNDANEELTPMMKAFAAEYIIDFNGTKAAERAGSKAKNKASAASEYLRNPRVQAEIAKLQQERAKRTAINADWVLRRLAEEADADIADLYSENGALKPVSDWPIIWRKGLITGIKHTEVRDREGNATGDVIVELRYSDRIKRIELIGKHVDVQAFREQVKTDSNVVLNINPDDADL